MFKQSEDLCDVRVLSFQRPFKLSNLTQAITNCRHYITTRYLGPVVLDFSNLSHLRTSEIMALADLLADPNKRYVSGILVGGSILQKLNNFGLSRMVPVATTRFRLVLKLGSQTLHATSAMFFCNQRPPQLGPLAHYDERSLADPMGMRPWVDGLYDLFDIGIRDVTVVLSARNLHMAQSFRRLCPQGMSLRFQTDMGSYLYNAKNAFANGLGWGGDILLVDGWFSGSDALVEFALSHRLQALPASEMITHGHSKVMMLNESIMQDMLNSGFQSAVFEQIMMTNGQVNSVTPMCRWKDYSCIPTWAETIFSNIQNAVPNTGNISGNVRMSGRNVVAKTAHVDAGASLRNAIILDGVHVHGGAWLSDVIVGPTWSMDIRRTADIALDFTPSDCVTPLETIVDLEQRIVG